MSKFEKLIFIFCYLFILWRSSQAQKVTIIDQPDSQWCLACICQIISNCERTAECKTTACGKYQTNSLYWLNAGKIKLHNETSSDLDTAFFNCANDDDCANKMVASYLSNFSEDCNGDGAINCEDYLTIHLYSDRKTCKQRLPREMQESLRQCEEQINPNKKNTTKSEPKTPAKDQTQIRIATSRLPHPEEQTPPPGYLTTPSNKIGNLQLSSQQIEKLTKTLTEAYHFVSNSSGNFNWSDVRYYNGGNIDFHLPLTPNTFFTNTQTKVSKKVINGNSQEHRKATVTVVYDGKVQTFVLEST